MWLAASTESRCPSLAYEELLNHFMVPSIKSRFIRTDLLFLHKIFRNSIDSTHLVGQFGIAAPGRRLRHTGVLNVPFARVNTVKTSLFVRLPKLYNDLGSQNRTADISHSSSQYFAAISEYSRGQGTYWRLGVRACALYVLCIICSVYALCLNMSNVMWSCVQFYVFDCCRNWASRLWLAYM